MPNSTKRTCHRKRIRADASGSNFQANTTLAIKTHAKSLEYTNFLVRSSTLPTSAVAVVNDTHTHHVDLSTTFNGIIEDWVFEDRHSSMKITYSSGSETVHIPSFSLPGMGDWYIIQFIWMSGPQDQPLPPVTDGKITSNLYLYVKAPTERENGGGQTNWRF